MNLASELRPRKLHHEVHRKPFNARLHSSFINKSQQQYKKIEQFQMYRLISISIILSTHVMLAQAFIEPPTIANASIIRSKMLHRSTTGFLQAIPKRIEIPVPGNPYRHHQSRLALHSQILDIPLDKSTHSSSASTETVSTGVSWLPDVEDSMIESEVGIDFPTFDGQWHKNTNSLISSLVSQSELAAGFIIVIITLFICMTFRHRLSVILQGCFNFLASKDENVPSCCAS